METRRSGFRSLADGLVVLAFLTATVGVAWLLVREMGSGQAPPAAGSPAAPLPVPDGRRVPALMLSDGRQVKAGQSLSEIAAALGAGTEEPGSPARVRLGLRHTKRYEAGGTRFTLVFEPYELNGEPRVVAIYMR
jgi:hypothetical protein